MSHSTHQSEYSKKLRDPRWQKRRLEILNRDEWTCQKCGEKERTLHVHHRRYVREWEPWDYTDGDLVTVCEDCHQVEYELKKDAEHKLIEILNIQGWWADEIDDLACSIAYAGGVGPSSTNYRQALLLILGGSKGIKVISEFYQNFLNECRIRPE